VTWTGIPAETLLWAALIGVVALLVLFFLRPRPRLLAVPSHVLWNKVIPRRIDPLIKEIIALLLQILVLLGVIAALGQPERESRPAVAVDESGTTRPLDRVVVVDLSASMATDEGGMTRLETVQQRVQELVNDLADGERLALVRAGACATVAVPLTDDQRRLGLAVRSLKGTPGRSDVDGALVWASQVLASSDGPAEIRIFSDAEIGEVPASDDVEVVLETVGTIRPNLAVIAFDVRATEGLPAQIEAFVRLANYSNLPASVVVTLETQTQVLGRARYTLGAGETLDRIYRFYPPHENRVEVLLQEIEFEGDPDGDALALDDTACAFLPELRPARVLLVSRGNQYLTMALGLIPGLELETVVPADYDRSRVASGRYDVVFYDTFIPERPPRVNSFFINPAGSMSGFEVVRRVETPVTTDWNLGHPLFANLVLRDLNVAVSGQFEPGAHDTRLIGTPTGPIALAREVGGVRQVAFGFDFADSDLPLRLAFPQLIFNTVLWMREGRAVAPPAGETHLARDPLWLVPQEGVTELQVLPLREGQEEGVSRARTVPAGDGPVQSFFPRTGYFELVGTEQVLPVAVSVLDPLESDLRETPTYPAPPANPAAPEPEPTAEPPWAPPWIWLGIVALVLMLGEFGVVNR